MPKTAKTGMTGNPSSLIEIRNEYRGFFPLNEAAVRRLARRMLKAAGFPKAGLSLLWVGGRRMRTLNRRFLNHDWTTDVVTFGYTEGRRLRQPSETEIPLGEIIISLDMAKKIARELGHSALYEFYFYLCHGILHLAGYDDDTPKKRAAMLKKQEDILEKIGIKKG